MGNNVIGGTNSNIRKVVGSTKVVRIDPEDNECKEVASMNEARHNAFGTAMHEWQNLYSRWNAN